MTNINDCLSHSFEASSMVQGLLDVYKLARRGAAGLGLTFCKMAVEAHNGKIWVECPEEDRGCTFNIKLPCELS